MTNLLQTQQCSKNRNKIIKICKLKCKQTTAQPSRCVTHSQIWSRRLFTVCHTYLYSVLILITATAVQTTALCQLCSAPLQLMWQIQPVWLWNFAFVIKLSFFEHLLSLFTYWVCKWESFSTFVVVWPNFTYLLTAVATFGLAPHWFSGSLSVIRWICRIFGSFHGFSFSKLTLGDG